MNDRVILITPPDDISTDGIRILAVNLFPEQSQILSNALLNTQTSVPMMIYIWKNSDPEEWLFDKKHKSQLILFNADDQNELIVGYMAAQKNSAYFGNLRTLHGFNKSAIYSVEDCQSYIQSLIGKYE